VNPNRLAFLILFFVLLPFLVVTNVQAEQPATITSSQPATSSTVIERSISFIKDIANIFFFFVLGIIGILSYIQAKKTVFTPLKAETFKLQLKVFQDILMFFQDPENIDADKGFDLNNILYLNARVMMDQYIALFFENEIEINEERQKERLKEMVGCIVTKEFMEKYVERIEYATKPENNFQPEEVLSTSEIMSEWQNYKYEMVHYTKKYKEKLEKISVFSSSPVIPKKLKDKLIEIEYKVHGNLSLVGEVLTDISSELIEKYPNAETITKADLTWIWNRYNAKRESITKYSEDIAEFIRSYLQVDDLLKN